MIVQRDTTTTTANACALGDHAWTREQAHGPGPTRQLCGCGRVTLVIAADGTTHQEVTR